MDSIPASTSHAGPANGPLAGLLVLDFGQAAVGPVAAEYLGMMGATVIKVESPRGDTVRHGVPLMQGTSTTFLGNNLGKFGIVLDLKTPQGVANAKRLVSIADVLIENFRSNDVMVRLGLGPDVLAALNPDLVYLASSAYGSGGPLDDMRSNEWLSEALTGFTSVTGPPGSGGEFSRGSANLDWNGAMINTVTVLAALVRRARGGGGGFFATSQLGSSIYGGTTRFAEVLAGGPAPQPMGAASPAIVPDDAFATTDGFIAISAPTNACWKRLCAALDRPNLPADPRFATPAARVEHRDVLTQELARIIGGDRAQAWQRRLVAADVPCAIVPQGGTLLDNLDADEQVRGLGLVRWVPSAYGDLASQAPHWRFAETLAGIAGGPPLLGEHTWVVLDNLDSKQSLIGALQHVRASQTPDPQKAAAQ